MNILIFVQDLQRFRPDATDKEAPDEHGSQAEHLSIFVDFFSVPRASLSTVEVGRLCHEFYNVSADAVHCVCVCVCVMEGVHLCVGRGVCACFCT